MYWGLIWIALLLSCALPGAARAEAVHGIAMHGAPALAADFRHFPSVNPRAPRGGRLNLGVQGTFDTLHPFIIKGSPANGLREYVYESLMARSPDEPFSLYGLIAERVEVPQDRGSITFFLRRDARFSDASPITAADVLFSYEMLREKGLPFYRSYYKKVASASVIDAHTVRFQFDTTGDRELPLIMSLMPVLPKHRFSPETFERTTLEPPVGSGPYVVAAIDAGRSITYRRNPNYWGRDLPTFVGRYNFDEVNFEYYRDGNTLFEAFKAGRIDVRHEDDPGRWAQGYNIPAVGDGRVLLREFPTGLPAGMSALVFNSRKPVFADPRVRRALILAFDFSWANSNLYHSLYARTHSLFQRSYLASTGKPADAAERALLAPFPDAVPAAIMAGVFRFPDSRDGSNRDSMRTASELLREAGFELDGDTLVSKVGRQPLRFEFLALTRAQERLMLAYRQSLKQLGIAVSIRQVDNSQYWARLKAFDFDMIQFHWRSSLSPGNEQSNRWGSAAAETQGSNNFAGVKSAAVDAMVEAILRANTNEEFTSAVRALDRTVLAGDYMIPLFHVQSQWIAHWRHVKAPERTPLTGVDFDTWWRESEK